jgi:hypothetical protein
MSYVLRPSLVLSLLAATTLTACGGGDGKQTSKIAAAFENRVDPKAKAQEAGEDMRKLKEKVAAEAEAAILAEIDKVTVPAADASTDLKAACEAMRGAYDGFVQKRLAGNTSELERWGVMKGLDLDKAVETCILSNSAKVAACQQNALLNASNQIGRDREGELLAACNKKYGAPVAVAPTGNTDKKPAG